MVRFDKCPICGKSVGYEDSAGVNHNFCIAMCVSGHTGADLGIPYSVCLKSNPFSAARVWNKAVRNYINKAGINHE